MPAQEAQLDFETPPDLESMLTTLMATPAAEVRLQEALQLAQQNESGQTRALDVATLEQRIAELEGRNRELQEALEQRDDDKKAEKPNWLSRIRGQ